jgi:hypothetical protein
MVFIALSHKLPTTGEALREPVNLLNSEWDRISGVAFFVVRRPGRQ